MRYNYRTGVSKKTKSRSKGWVALPVFGLIIGAYIVATVMSPAVDVLGGPVDATAKKLVSDGPNLGENRLYIPKINVDVAVVDIDGNEKAALELGAVHRAPDNGNPAKGGNFVVAAHRFHMGLTPELTRKKSPFYRIDQLATGDQLYVDYKGTRYAYEVTRKQQVSPNATEIEKRTKDDQLTLYSCSLAGPDAGREVIHAKPIGTIAWDTGSPKLKPRS
jgi:LPXTG-site transpeptidase (sortase) family protein